MIGKLCMTCGEVNPIINLSEGDRWTCSVCGDEWRRAGPNTVDMTQPYTCRLWLQLYATKRSLEELARICDVSKDTIRWFLTRYELPCQGETVPPPALGRLPVQREEPSSKLQLARVQRPSQESSETRQELGLAFPERSSVSLTYLYFITDHTGATKIGRTTNLQRRLRGLQVSNSRELILRHYLKGPAKKISLLEAQLHRALREYHLRGEWFDVPDVLLDAICKITEDNVHYLDRFIDSQELKCPPMPPPARKNSPRSVDITRFEVGLNVIKEGRMNITEEPVPQRHQARITAGYPNLNTGAATRDEPRKDSVLERNREAVNRLQTMLEEVENDLVLDRGVDDSDTFRSMEGRDGTNGPPAPTDKR